jgi:chromosome segregation ATPase
MATLENERRLVKDRCSSLEERLVSAEERSLALQHELDRYGINITTPFIIDE